MISDWVRGKTLKEIADEHGLCPARIPQFLYGSLRMRRYAQERHDRMNHLDEYPLLFAEITNADSVLD